MTHLEMSCSVYRVPEAATTVFGGGISFVGASPKMQFEINHCILKVSSYYAIDLLTASRQHTAPSLCNMQLHTSHQPVTTA